MAETIKIDAKWIGEGANRTLFADVPLEAYNEAPNPLVDYAAFAAWSEALDARLRAIADAKA